MKPEYHYISLTRTHLNDKWFCLWRPKGAGYTAFVEMSGLFEEPVMPDQTMRSEVSIPKEEVAKYATEVMYENNIHLVLPNTEETRNAFNIHDKEFQASVRYNYGESRDIPKSVPPASSDIEKYDTLAKIVTQLELCEFRTADTMHDLKMNAAFIALKKMSEAERPKPEREPFKQIVKRLAFWSNHEWQTATTKEFDSYRLELELVARDARKLMREPTLCEWCGKEAHGAPGMEDDPKKDEIHAHNVHDSCYESILNGSGMI